MSHEGFSIVQYLSDFFVVVGSEWVLYLLLLLSVISLFVIVERLRALGTELDDLELLTARLRVAARAPDPEKGERELAPFRGMAARVVREGLRERVRGVEAADEAMSAAIVREKLRLERNTAFLGTLGNNAPFIGLFGTVLGVMRAFQDLGAAGAEASTTTVMTGISEALVATAVGLFVALPAVMVYNLLGRRIKTIAIGAEALSHVLLSELKGTKVSPAQAKEA
jgi:biopolymer transport protein ExbB